MKISSLIVAAGSGERFGSQVPKQYLSLGGRMVVEHSINAFRSHAEIADICLVVSPKHTEYFSKIDIPHVMGGATRSESVLAGVQALKSQGADYVLIHDAARPFISHPVIDSVVDALKSGKKGVIPVVACVDTIKTGGEAVTGTIDRATLNRVQTPQGFHIETLLAAYDQCNTTYTDDAQALEAMGVEVGMVVGCEDTFKITTKDDYKRAQQMVEKIRVGQGFDVHQLIDGDGVILGGVKIPCNMMLKGHSDADVVLHALVDAMLGAMGKGDIGQHFSPSDERWKGADSTMFVKQAMTWMEEGGFLLQNADITIICEAPKIGPHRDAIHAQIAKLLKLAPQDVNIKATTTEKLGFTGRGEGIAAQAVVCMRG